MYASVRRSGKEQSCSGAVATLSERYRAQRRVHPTLGRPIERYAGALISEDDAIADPPPPSFVVPAVHSRQENGGQFPRSSVPGVRALLRVTPARSSRNDSFALGPDGGGTTFLPGDRPGVAAGYRSTLRPARGRPFHSLGERLLSGYPILARDV